MRAGDEGETMRADDMIMVSVDDHLVEPPDMFEGRLPAAMAERAPHIERSKDGSDVWVFNGTRIPNIGLNAVAGRSCRTWLCSARKITSRRRSSNAWGGT